MTADSMVAEVEAAGGTALGIEVDVRDHEAVEAWSRVSSRNGVGSMCGRECRGRSRTAYGHQGQHP
jgi:hypothetical protein